MVSRPQSIRSILPCAGIRFGGTATMKVSLLCLHFVRIRSLQYGTCASRVGARMEEHRARRFATSL